MPELRPLDIVREAVKAGHDDAAEIVTYAKEKHSQRLLPAVAGRLLGRVRGEQQRVVGALTTGKTEDGQVIDPVVTREVGALIKKHGLAKVQTAVEMAAWFVG